MQLAVQTDAQLTTSSSTIMLLKLKDHLTMDTAIHRLNTKAIHRLNTRAIQRKAAAAVQDNWE